MALPIDTRLQLMILVGQFSSCSDIHFVLSHSGGPTQSVGQLCSFRDQQQRLPYPSFSFGTNPSPRSRTYDARET